MLILVLAHARSTGDGILGRSLANTWVIPLSVFDVLDLRDVVQLAETVGRLPGHKCVDSRITVPYLSPPLYVGY
jgi:hypothetical protein